MNRYCDYDSIIHYQPGEFASKFAEKLEEKLEQTKRDEKLTTSEVESFLDGAYNTYYTKQPIVMYRLYGKYQKEIKLNEGNVVSGARLLGRFVSTEFAESCIDAKLRLALKPEWKNTKMYEAKIIVPAGIKVSVGIVGPVALPTGTVLPGGAPQVILPSDWPEQWIQGYRRVSGRQLQIEPVYWSNEPEEISVGKNSLYSSVCPRCCYWKTRKLAPEEQVTIIGSKGRHYTMKQVCLNTECNFHW